MQVGKRQVETLNERKAPWLVTWVSLIMRLDYSVFLINQVFLTLQKFLRNVKEGYKSGKRGQLHIYLVTYYAKELSLMLCET